MARLRACARRKAVKIWSFKDKRFAAGCSRDIIRQGAGLLGWELDELLDKTLAAMRASEDAIEAEMAAL